MIMTASSLLERGDELRLYYGGWDAPHGTFDRRATIGLATWPRDRIVSLSSRTADGGEIVTRPARAGRGGELHVNANFSAPGSSLFVEVVGEGIRSTPFTGDEIDARITWAQPGIVPPSDREVRLRFLVQGGDLYSFSWR
jgi:hypothetical protein